MYKNSPERRERERNAHTFRSFSHASGAAAQELGAGRRAGARAGGQRGPGWFRCDSVLYYKTSRTQNCSPPPSLYAIRNDCSFLLRHTHTPSSPAMHSLWRLPSSCTRARGVAASGRHQTPKGLSRFFSAAPGTQSCYCPVARSVARPLAGSAQWPRVGAAPASAGFCGCRDSCWAPDLCRQG